MDIRKELDRVYEIVFLEESHDNNASDDGILLTSLEDDLSIQHQQRSNINETKIIHPDNEQLSKASMETVSSSTCEDNNITNLTYGPTQHDLPPWSQLNPTDLLAMPDNMRATLLKQYSDREQAAVTRKRPISPSQPHQSPKRPKTKRTPGQKTPTHQNGSTGAKRTFTLTQMFPPQSPSKHRSVANSVNDLSEWDPNVLNELPAGK